MTVVVGGSSPQITFADSTVQNTAFTGLNQSASPYTTSLGYQALNSNTGTNNTAIGYQSLQANTTASQNIAVGYQSLYSNTTSSSNVALGYQAGYSLTTGVSYGSNTFVGQSAGKNATGDINTFIGSGSGNAVTSGQFNTIIGAYSGNQNGLDLRTSSSNVVLSDGAGNIQLYVNSVGSRSYASGYVAEGVFTWGNVSSATQDLNTLFANMVAYGLASISITLQVITQGSTTTPSSALINGLKSGNNTWSFTSISSLNQGGVSISASGSGTSVTLTFGSGGQFGHCKVSLVAQT